MAEAKASAEQVAAAEKARAQPAAKAAGGVVAGSLIGSHTLTHIYSHGFQVIIPELYKNLGLVPLSAGLIDTVRWLSSGFFSLLVGFFVDMFQHRRGLFLGLSMAIIGVGYLLVSVAPTYFLILIAIAFAATGGSIWHPPALGLLSQRFPKHRGLMMALHRATGSVGDTFGPMLVGFLMMAGIVALGPLRISAPGLSWRGVLQVGFPVSVGLALLIWLLLWKVGGPKVKTPPFRSNFVSQMGVAKKALASKGMFNLLAVAALRGMGDRALVLFLPLYLAVDLGMNSLQVGFRLGLLTALGVFTGPVFGSLSDRLGRKPVIIGLMLVGGTMPLLIANAGTGGLLLAVIVLTGIFMYTVNSLVQAAALDLVEGQRLEGTFIGLLWGFNSLFAALSPLVAGAIAGFWGFKAALYYAASMTLIGGLLATRLPRRAAVARQAAGHH
ncbi:MAG: MFS transporter [Chloroflexi bacterium]|nr:MFS transporter [Chloroflexota bacterium]